VESQFEWGSWRRIGRRGKTGRFPKVLVALVFHSNARWPGFRGTRAPHPDLLGSRSRIHAIQYCSNAGQQLVFAKGLFENRRV